MNSDKVYTGKDTSEALLTEDTIAKITNNYVDAQTPEDHLLRMISKAQHIQSMKYILDELYEGQFIIEMEYRLLRAMYVNGGHLEKLEEIKK
jgi:hypothetical protein